MISRLGVFGGMFDPVHRGHIEAALYALDLLALDKLKLVPCRNPNHRDPAFTGSQQRLEMLELATAGHARIEVDPIEINREGVSYSVDTLEAYMREGIAGSLVFVLGMDAFNSLPGWHRWADILELCHLLVMARPGAEVDDAVKEQLNFTARQVIKPEQLFAESFGNIFIVRDFEIDISSTQVRSSLQSGDDASNLLDARVSQYINEHGLYTSPGN